MAQRVVVHVGLPKSGTTYLQTVLGANRARLREQDQVLYPGPTWGAQVDAVRDLLDANPHGVQHERTSGAWPRLAGEVRRWDGDAVISMEWLCSAKPAQASRLVRSLSPAEVHVVLTVRDLGRTLPAAWQEFMRNWETDPWQEFLDAVSGDDPFAVPIGGLFWRQQDVGRMLPVWRDVVPDDHIHVVTVPHPGTAGSELWLRFASVLGVDPTRYDPTGRAVNESVGLASSELLRVFNERSRQAQLGWPAYSDVVKEGLAKRGLAPRRPKEPAVAVPAELHPWLHERAKRQRSVVEESGVQVVGDLAELEPVLTDGQQPHQLGPAQLLDAAVDGLIYLARRTHEQGTAAAETADEVRALRLRVADLEAEIERRRSRPAKQAVIDASERHRGLLAARRAYWRAAALLRRGRRGGDA